MRALQLQRARRGRRHPVTKLLTVILLTGTMLASAWGASTQVAAAAEAADHDLVPVYVVRSSHDGTPETLDEVARRFLGSADAADEIARLNDGITQPDGGQVQLNGTLRPGWVLTLPARASGPGILVGKPGALTTTTQPLQLLPIILGAALVVTVLAAPAVLWTFVWRRRTVLNPPAQSGAPAADRDAWLIDRSLRVMLAHCVAEKIRPPAPYLIAIDQERVVLHLNAPQSRAPLPYRASENATEWVALIKDVQDASTDPGIPNRAATVVILGESDGTLHAIDIALAGGVVQVTGDAARRRALIAEWGRQLRNAPWADNSLPILVSGFSAGAIAESRYVDGLTAAQTELTAGGPLVLLADDLDRRDQPALQQILETPGAPRAVVVGGDFATARWVFDVSDDGSVRSDLLNTAAASSANPT